MIPYYTLTAIHLGPLTLNVWGLFAGVAFAVALFIALKEAKRKNINEDNIFDIAILTLVGGVAGARAAFIIENWDYFSRNQAEILSIKEGGLMFLGGAVSVLLLIGAYIRLKKLNGWNIIDSLVPSFAIGEFIGRIGCALADLHIGSVTSLPWAQEYTDGSFRHPIAIYMSLNGLAMFAAFWYLRTKIKIEGALFLLFVLWYSGIRFFLDFLRCGDLAICDPRYSGYTPSQYISLGVFIVSFIYLFKILNNPPTGGKKHMAEQKNDNGENKDLQGSVVSYTEVEEVVFESSPDSAENGGNLASGGSWKDKARDMAKKSWAMPLAAVLILAIGVAVSAVYFNSVYYGNMFKKALFSFQGKTWVSYSDPIVQLTVVNDKDCTSCDPEQIIRNFKSGFAPTANIVTVNYDSQEGKDLINKFSIKSVPAFIFDSNVEKLEAFKEAGPEYLSQIFIKKDNLNLLNPLVVSDIANRLQIDLGRFINPPEVSVNDRILGLASAPVTIIEFSDFQCPYCKQENDVVKQVLAAYPDKVRLVFKNFPLTSIHQNAQYAAEAAECAGDQGKFFEMGDMLFVNQSKLDAASIAKYAGNLKLDAKKFKDCVDSGKFKSKVENDVKVANEFGIGGTPAFFIGNQLYQTALPFDQFKQIIDTELAK